MIEETGCFTDALKKNESAEQGEGGFIYDEHGPAQPWPPGSLVSQEPAYQRRVAELMRDGMSQAEAKDYIATRGGLAIPTLHDGAAAVQAFNAGGEIVRISHTLESVKALVTAHNENLALLNTGFGEFRDKIIKPIHEELKFLRYNLGDKANVTVSQMQGALTHMSVLFNALATIIGKTPEQIAAIREQLGIPENIPSLEQLEAQGRPAVDLGAMQIQIEGLVAQNQRLLKANEQQRIASEEKERRNREALEALMARLAKLETPSDVPTEPTGPRQSEPVSEASAVAEVFASGLGASAETKGG